MSWSQTPSAFWGPGWLTHTHTASSSSPCASWQNACCLGIKDYSFKRFTSLRQGFSIPVLLALVSTSAPVSSSTVCPVRLCCALSCILRSSQAPAFALLLVRVMSFGHVLCQPMFLLPLCLRDHPVLYEVEIGNSVLGFWDFCFTHFKPVMGNWKTTSIRLPLTGNLPDFSEACLLILLITSSLAVLLFLLATMGYILLTINLLICYQKKK